MGENTKIEWAHHTFNPWQGCAKVSDGCKNCYAETHTKRFGKVQWGANGTRVRTSAANWNLPLKWNKQAEAEGIRYRVFCASLADVFEDRDDLHAWRAELLYLIKTTPHLDWLLLTKRPENVIPLIKLSSGWAHRLTQNQHLDLSEYIGGWIHDKNPPHNVWIGTSVENQEQADKRIPELLKIPAAVRFLSMEPLLGQVRIFRDSDYHAIQTPVGLRLKGNIDWVIVGGESGPNARPMHPDWARSIRDQCNAAGVPFLFKQWGEWAPGSAIPGGNLRADVEAGKVLQLYNGREPDGHFRRGDAMVRRLGKHSAGRTLYGRTWDEVPEAANAQPP